MTNEIALAKRFAALHRWLDGHRAERAPVVERLGGGYLAIDPASVAPFPSSNRNKVQFFGCGRRVREADLDAIAGRYREAGVERFFFWLSPSPQAEAIAGWLAARGVGRFEGTGYPNLARSAEILAVPAIDFAIRRIRRGEVPGLIEDLEAIYPGGVEEFLPARVGRRGFYHYAAFDGRRAVAGGVLAVHRGMGYLAAGATRESHRRRGAQGALIAARVNEAVRLGCDIATSETLYFLENSLRNLQRKGFEICYEQKVYEWRLGAK